MKRIPKVTDPIIIRALLPGAKPYNYTVTYEDFDKYDADAPGHYYGVDVADDVADRWDAGRAAAKAAGVELRSREGMTLRYEAMHGTRELPQYLLDWLDAAEKAANEKLQAQRDREARRAAYAAHKQGYTEVGSDAYTSEFWGLTKRATLPVVASISGEDTGCGYGGNQLLRLPNGDLMEILQEQSWTRYTRDPALIADRMMRKSITHHRYSPELFAALTALENIRTGLYYSWFGGPSQSRTELVRAYSGCGNRTGAETEARLPEYLREVIELCRRNNNAAGVAAAEACLPLIVPGCITHVMASSL